MEITERQGRTFAEGQVEHPDGRVELIPIPEAEEGKPYRDGQRVVELDPALINDDLAPTAVSARKWTTYNYAALWVSMAHCIPTYMLASGLIEAGMVWKDALLTIALGNAIVLIPILLNSHPGTKYGIPFPVFARASYGVFGSNVPAIMRAIVACGWFGIQCWIGGAALQTFLRSLWSGWPTALGATAIGGHLPTMWLSFLIFWGLNILIVFKGMDVLRHVENWAAPYVLVMTALLVIWAIKAAHGLGPILAHSITDEAAYRAKFWKLFFPSLTAMIGFWATLSLNMPDFTRFGRSQKEQVFGQVVALPTTMTLFAAMGILITSATTVIYGKAIWDPVELVGKFQSRWVVAIAMFTVVVATLSVNIAANVVSPANDFANLFPKRITFRIGGLITGLIGIAMMPWKLVADPSGYIFKWLLGYSGGLGSIAGVLIADYWVVRKKHLVLADLYRRDGAYAFRLGTNWVAVFATLAGCLAAWGGLLLPAIRGMFDYAWFIGLFVSFFVYWGGMRISRPPAKVAT